MAEYIGREALIEACHWVIRSDGTRVYVCHAEDIENAPAADVAPARHGQAFYLDDFANAGWYCDQCHKKHPKKPKFCSNCGAKLDLEAQHE